jgi:hypothetical protein
MEQTNLVVTPDGQTWDEVTRDTSYMGEQVYRVMTDTENLTTGNEIVFDEHRGAIETYLSLGWKNLCHAYDREICLRDGVYHILVKTARIADNDWHCNILINGSRLTKGLGGTGSITITSFATVHLKRGDYVQIEGGWKGDMTYSAFEITRLDRD